MIKQKITVEPRYNQPLYNEDPRTMNGIFQPSSFIMYGKEPQLQCNEPLLERTRFLGPLALS